MEHMLIVRKIDLDTIKIIAIDSQWTLMQIISHMLRFRPQFYIILIFSTYHHFISMFLVTMTLNKHFEGCTMLPQRHTL